MEDVVVVEVHGTLDQSQSERVAEEVEVGLRVVYRGGDVVQAKKADGHGVSLTPFSLPAALF
jgi:hypothetical protein